MEGFFVTISIITVAIGLIVGIIAFLNCLIDEDRYPWQHKRECPCGKCFARRMREAVERAEYERQQDEIREGVREVNRR